MPKTEAWVAPSERAGVEEDNRAARLAAMFGGAADHAVAAQLRKTPVKTVSTFGINLEKDYKGTPRSSVQFTRPQQPAAPAPAPVVEAPRGEIVHEHNVNKTTWERRHSSTPAKPTLRRLSVTSMETDDVAQSLNGLGMFGASIGEDEVVEPPATPGRAVFAKPAPRTQAVTPARKAMTMGGKSQISLNTPPPTDRLTRSATFSTPRRTGNVCPVCTRTVYKMEETRVDGEYYHKWCFKCKECSKTLSSGGYAKVHGTIYCKPHFSQLFKEKGNYDEAFGHTQRKREWTSPEKSASQGC